MLSYEKISKNENKFWDKIVLYYICNVKKIKI